MNEIDTPRLPESPSRFTIAFRWSETADRPFYEAILTSSRDDVVEPDDSATGVAVIDLDELRNIIRVLRAAGATFAAGAYVSDEPEYYAQITADGAVWNCGLGFNRKTVDILQQVAAVVNDHARRVVLEIVKAIRPTIDKQKEAVTQ